MQTLKALVHQRSYSPNVKALLAELPELRHVIVIEDGHDEDDPSDGRRRLRRGARGAEPGARLRAEIR